MYIAILPAWTSAHHMHIQCPGRPKGDIRSLRLELHVIMSHHAGYWESNPHLLVKKPVLLPAGPFL